MEVYASFGGLLMRLKGEATALSALDLDMAMYLLMKRV